MANAESGGGKGAGRIDTGLRFGHESPPERPALSALPTPMSRLCLRLLAVLLPPTACLAATAPDPGPDLPAQLPHARDYFDLRAGAANARLRFERDRTGRVGFLGGSITAGAGWRDHVIRNLQARFPETKFDFVSAGIGSLGSVPHAFRLERDLLARGPLDLVFVEAAVNDTTNTAADPVAMLRGMEGVVRRLRLENPATDILQLHFAMPEHLKDHAAGRVPVSIAQHERIASAYGTVSLNLSLEVSERIRAGQFAWDKDFKNLHPSPFGNRLYAAAIERMFAAAWAGPLPEAIRPHPLPAPVDPRSYFRGRYGNVADVVPGPGFAVVPAWKPADGKGTRAGFVNVPVLVGTEPGAEFSFRFNGTGVGLFVAAGPDAGRIEFSIDGAEFQKTETFTPWSANLHLPWAVLLDDNLPPGEHSVRVRIAADHDPRGTGTALRVVHLLLN